MLVVTRTGHIFFWRLMDRKPHLQVLVEPLLRQLLADIDAEHVNADPGEAHVPAVRQKQLLFECLLWRELLELALLSWL